jgi:hypothetical protein
MINLEEYEIPVIEVNLLKSINVETTGGLSDKISYENFFRLQGTLSLKGYLNYDKVNSTKDILEILKKDIDN